MENCDFTLLKSQRLHLLIARAVEEANLFKNMESKLFFSEIQENREEAGGTEASPG